MAPRQEQAECAIPVWPDQPASGPRDSVCVVPLASGDVTVHIPDLFQCGFASVLLVPAAGTELALALASSTGIDPDTVPLEVTLVIWTSADRSGKSCEAPYEDGSCVRMTRQLPLTVDAHRTALRARFVPDASSAHYLIAVKVRSFAASGGDDIVCLRV